LADEAHRLDPATVRAWQRIARDILIVVLGAFMLTWQTVIVALPNPLLVGAGLVLLGLPPALRLDEVFKSKPPDEDDDAGFTHMERPR
jgi:hypothetical protein